MKTTHLSLLFLASATLLSAGCGKKDEAPPPAAPVAPPVAAPTAPVAAPEKSTASTVIDGVTGKTAVDAGFRARDQIKAISETKKNEQDEVLQ